MKILQMVGYRSNWNLDALYNNDIGQGFVFCAYSFKYGVFEKSKIHEYDMNEVLSRSLIDFQFFGKKASGNINKGNLGTYPFHPAANLDDDQETDIYLTNNIKKAIEYQYTLGLKNIVIPNYYENDNLDKFLGIVKSINKWLIENKRSDTKYYMSIPITHHTIIDADKIEKLLYVLTDLDIVFDGYYIVCEPKPENMQKVSTDYKYLKNLSRVFEVLKKQKFRTIYAYANWDAIIFLATTDIDYVSVATFENLRNFNIKRFLSSEDGGASKGWYYSEKLLNLIKAPLIDLIRAQNGIEVIRNERNIFSDDLLKPTYPWNNNKQEVHKNYLLSVARLLTEISAIKDLAKRKEFVISLVDQAINAYQELEAKGIYLTFESKNYHLDTWKSYLLSRKV